MEEELEREDGRLNTQFMINWESMSEMTHWLLLGKGTGLSSWLRLESWLEGIPQKEDYN